MAAAERCLRARGGRSSSASKPERAPGGSNRSPKSLEPGEYGDSASASDSGPSRRRAATAAVLGAGLIFAACMGLMGSDLMGDGLARNSFGGCERVGDGNTMRTGGAAGASGARGAGAGGAAAGGGPGDGAPPPPATASPGGGSGDTSRVDCNNAITW